MIMSFPILATVGWCSFFIGRVVAFPHGDRRWDNSTYTSDPSSGTPNSNGISMQIWLPVVFIVLLGFVFMVTKCRRRSNRRAAAQAISARSVTANQLVGEGNATGQDPSRRSRRPRRTPSQISTTSLPAYMKEPGDEELVIYRGASDMEDAQLAPPNVLLPRVEEQQDAEQSVHSRNASQLSGYPPIPIASNDTPLLQTRQSDDATPQDPNLQSRADRRSNGGSFDTSSSSEIIANGQSDGDPRGEAPPYLEMDPTSLASFSNTNMPNSSHQYAPPSSSPPPPANDGAGNPTRESRRSGFRNFFSAFSNSGSRTPATASVRAPGNGHVRSASSISTNISPSDASHSPEPSHQPTHRPSHSGGSISLLNVSNFRPISRQRSNNTMNSNRMNSPSLISLQSISAPLTHTLVRTEFTYPKAGLTAEQLKVISSRESLGKFGIPYGADAIAYASSSTTRPDLPPPPDFDAPSVSAPSPLGQEVFTAPGRSLGSATTKRSAVERVVTPSPLNPTSTASQKGNGKEIANLAVGSLTQATTVKPVDSDGLRALTPEVLPTPSGSSAPPSSYRIPVATAASLGPRSESRASSFMSLATYATAAESMGTGTNSDSEPSTPRHTESQFRHGQEGTEATVTPRRDLTTPSPPPR